MSNALLIYNQLHASGISEAGALGLMGNWMAESGLEDEVSIQFMSIHSAGGKLNEFDIVCCCPHLRVEMNTFYKDFHPEIPIYILPKRMYGQMKFRDIYEDALDILEIYKDHPQNEPTHFPNEEDFAHIERASSYRSTYGDYHQYLK